MKTVGIVGGGFCGTLTAVNLARLARGRLRVVVVNRGYPTGRGVAYGTSRPEHLLNVVARNMSAFPDLPTHFVDWLGNRTEFESVPPAELREQFVPRRVYGDYLRDLLFWHARPLAGPANVQVETIEDEVVDLEPRGRGAVLALADGPPMEVDRVVLASGNLAPRELSDDPAVLGHPAYRGNPWDAGGRDGADPGSDVLLVGTGLTMIDTFLTLRTLGRPGAIHAVSRTGLLPLAHFKGTDYPDFPPPGVESMGLRELVALVEEHCRRLRSRGLNPAVVVDKLRPETQRIWRNLSLEDRREFSRKYRTRWNVARHRIPPSVASQIEEARAGGRLAVHKGRVAAIRPDGASLRVAIEPGDGGPGRELRVGLLVNCTGPAESLREARSGLFRRLFERGLVRPDELDMGIEVAPNFAVVDGRGEPSSTLFALGPLLKGTLWETTAVPELRSQAHLVAQALLAEEPSPQPAWASDTPADLVEYYI
jgi:uncharacterized NAD(P)/FAD-binding protein YdhS